MSCPSIRSDSIADTAKVVLAVVVFALAATLMPLADFLIGEPPVVGHPSFEPHEVYGAVEKTVGATVEISAPAFAGAGIERVSFSLDGTSMCTFTTAPFACAWDTTKVPNGERRVGEQRTDRNHESAARRCRTQPGALDIPDRRVANWLDDYLTSR
jgi:hypothetical protein